MVPTYNIIRENNAENPIEKGMVNFELGTLASHCPKLLYSVPGWSILLFVAPKAFLAFSRTLHTAI